MISLICWNVNGIRASLKKGALQWVFDVSPHLFCLQETKATIEQIPESCVNAPPYEAHFVSPLFKKGYSGVSIHTKQKPLHVQYGLGIPELDTEGRLIQMEFEDVYVLTVYFPNGGGGPERLAYKLAFYDAFLSHIQVLQKKKHVIFCGDVNTAHAEIDLARPKENEKNTGFLPEERAWIDAVINTGFVDIFRHMYPRRNSAYTYWDQKTGARARNVGWRIDYFFCDAGYLPQVHDIRIHDSVTGSDHCPIELILNCSSL